MAGLDVITSRAAVTGKNQSITFRVSIKFLKHQFAREITPFKLLFLLVKFIVQVFNNSVLNDFVFDSIRRSGFILLINCMKTSYIDFRHNDCML